MHVPREKAEQLEEIRKTPEIDKDLVYDIRIKLNISPFEATTFEGVKDIVFSWSVDKNKGTMQYLEAIMNFYKDLKSGIFETECSDPYEIMLQTELRNEKGFKTAGLEFALENYQALARRYSRTDFYSLHAFTPYCLISLDGNNRIWTPEDGRICVVSSQNLSKPLSKFMHETLDVQTTRSELEQQLRETYKKQKHPKLAL